MGLFFKNFHKSESGAATVEFAMALPAIILFLMICVTVGMFGIKEIQCVNASGVVARTLAMGKSENEAIEVGKRIAGNGSAINISTNN